MLWYDSVNRDVSAVDEDEGAVVVVCMHTLMQHASKFKLDYNRKIDTYLLLQGLE